MDSFSACLTHLAKLLMKNAEKEPECCKLNFLFMFGISLIAFFF